MHQPECCSVQFYCSGAWAACHKGLFRLKDNRQQPYRGKYLKLRLAFCCSSTSCSCCNAARSALLRLLGPFADSLIVGAGGDGCALLTCSCDGTEELFDAVLLVVCSPSCLLCSHHASYQSLATAVNSSLDCTLPTIWFLCTTACYDYFH